MIWNDSHQSWCYVPQDKQNQSVKLTVLFVIEGFLQKNAPHSLNNVASLLLRIFWIIVVTVRSLSTRAAPSASLVFTYTCWLVFVQPKGETATNAHDAILYWFNNGHCDKLLCRSAPVCNCTHQKRNRKMKPDTQTTTLAWGRLCFILTTCSIYATAGQVGN